MKIETAVLSFKGLFIIGGAFCASAGSALAQYADSNAWPSTICWIVMALGAIGAACLAGLGFLSSSFGSYMQGKATDKAVAAGVPIVAYTSSGQAVTNGVNAPLQPSKPPVN